RGAEEGTRERPGAAPPGTATRGTGRRGTAGQVRARARRSRSRSSGSALEATRKRHDRRWMIVDDGGTFITQRTRYAGATSRDAAASRLAKARDGLAACASQSPVTA